MTLPSMATILLDISAPRFDSLNRKLQSCSNDGTENSKPTAGDQCVEKYRCCNSVANVSTIVNASLTCAPRHGA